jgi:hypothetical protein
MEIGTLAIIWFFLTGIILGGGGVLIVLMLWHEDIWKACVARGIKTLRRRNRKIAELTVTNRKLARDNAKLRKGNPI